MERHDGGIWMAGKQEIDFNICPGQMINRPGKPRRPASSGSIFQMARTASREKGPLLQIVFDDRQGFFRRGPNIAQPVQSPVIRISRQFVHR
jgi:hypothetical protein